MPATPPPLPPVVHAELVGSTVVVTGTAANDGVQLQKYRNTLIVRSGNYLRLTAGPGCTYANYAVTCTGRKLSSVVNLGAGDDTIVTPRDKVTTVINAGDGNDTVFDFAGTDVIHGGNGIDTVDYSYRQGEVINATPGTGADDGTVREHDDIGADVERVLLPKS
jgi:Ca2+-binding RTX toxin-like protein